MILFQTNEYGPLSNLITWAGWLLASAGALLLGFKKRARWEPSEEDISRGPQRVGSLLVVVAIAILWTQARSRDFLPQLNKLTLILLGATVLSLLLYSILVGTLTYEKVDAPGGQIRTQKFIGGFWLTKGAQTILKHKAAENPPIYLTKRQLLKGAGYDPDLVWSPFSRALAKAVFVIFYIGLTAFGTITLLCASIIFGIGQTAESNEDIYARATAYQQKGDRESREKEIAEYDKLIKVNYKIVSVFHNRGYAYERLASFYNCKGNFDNAISDYTSSISNVKLGVQPDAPQSSLALLYLARGVARERAGHLKGAFDDLKLVCDKGAPESRCAEAKDELKKVEIKMQKFGEETEPRCGELPH